MSTKGKGPAIFPSLRYTQYAVIAYWILAKAEYFKQNNVVPLDHVLAEWFVKTRPDKDDGINHISEVTGKKNPGSYPENTNLLPNCKRLENESYANHARRNDLLQKRYVQGVIERLIHDKFLVVLASDQLAASVYNQTPDTLYRCVVPASNVSALGLLVHLLTQQEEGKTTVQL